MPEGDRQYPEAQLVRMQEPYHFQRQLHQMGEYPRLPQPGIQPNAKSRVVANNQRQYWHEVYKRYMEGKG